jgi:lysophospholipase L1-like esterase
MTFFNPNSPNVNGNTIFTKIVQLSQAEIDSPTSDQLNAQDTLYQLEEEPYTLHYSNGEELQSIAPQFFVDQATIDAADDGDPLATYILSTAPYTRYYWTGDGLQTSAGADFGALVDALGQIFATKSELSNNINQAIAHSTQRGNHTGTQLASTVRFDAGETLESMKTAFLSQGTSPSADAPTLDTVPTINDTTPVVGQTLTATTGTVTEGSGAAHTNVWQWFRTDPTDGITDILGATANTYDVTSDDNGYFLGVRQQPIDSVTGIPGNTRTSAITSAVGGAIPANSVLPSISPTGTHEAGDQQYTISAGTWSNTPTSYNYSIRVAGNQVGSSVTTASTSITWTPNVAGPFGALTVSVVGINANGVGDPAVSTSSVTITEPSTATADGYVDITSAMWDEMETEAAINGDPYMSTYRTNVAGMTATGGTVVAPGGDIRAAVTSSSSSKTVLQNGTYTLTGSTQLTLSGTRKILVQDGATATIDCTGLTSSFLIIINGTHNHLGAAGTGILKFINRTGSGIVATNSTCRDAVVRHVVIQGGSGNGPGGIVFQDDVYRSCIVSCAVRERGSGGDEDGFALRYCDRATTSAPVCSNAVIGCYAYRTTDDGFDFWSSQDPQYAYFCTAEQMGKNVTYPNGDGSGFKLGGDGASVVHHLYKCNAIDNKNGGFHRNSNGMVNGVYQDAYRPHLKGCTSTGNDVADYYGSVSYFLLIPLESSYVTLIGDSTVLDASGWGGGFADTLPQFTVLNEADSGESARSFYNCFWDAALAAAPVGSTILIQFGHNDNFGPSNDCLGMVKETTVAIFQTHITAMANEARAVGVFPVFVTPLDIADGAWDGTFISNYADGMIATGTTLSVPVVDLHYMSRAYNLSIGQVAANALYTDGVHLNSTGGDIFGEMVADELLVVAPHLA